MNALYPVYRFVVILFFLDSSSIPFRDSMAHLKFFTSSVKSHHFNFIPLLPRNYNSCSKRGQGDIMTVLEDLVEIDFLILDLEC